MKIREIYTVVRERPIKNLQEALDRIPYIRDEGISEFLYSEIHDDERVELKFQIDNGNGWEDLIPKINMTEVSRFSKFRKISYYRGTKCACGSKKISFCWSCLSCREKLKGSEEDLRLAKCCSEHFLAADNYIGKIKALSQKI